MSRPTFDELRARMPQKYEGKGLYAARPGTGPKGKTCHDCAHLRYSGHGTDHPKCGKAAWTSGDATTIRTRTAACHLFEERLRATPHARP